MHIWISFRTSWKSPSFTKWPSVGKRPQREELFDAVPDFGQPPGFKNEETDNHGSEDNRLERYDQLSHSRRMGLDHVGEHIENFGNQGHENGAENGSDHASQPPHDHHGQILHAENEGEVLRGHDL